MRGRRLLRPLWRSFLLLAGVLCFVLALKGLIEPNRLLSGGVTGTSLLLYRLVHLPVGLAIALLNVPIFALGIRDIGRPFAIRSGAAVLASWLLIDYAPIAPLTHDPLLAGVFGGVLMGCGTALALKANGSLGGFDILGVVLARRFGVGVGESLLALNGILVVTAGVIGSPELAMYTLIAIFGSSRTIDALQTPRPRRAFLIMTRKPEPIRDQVLRRMNRGITVFRAEGAWTGAGITALLCVITRQEQRELEDILQTEDREAFIVVLESSEVLGRFRTPDAAAYWKRLQEPLRKT